MPRSAAAQLNIRSSFAKARVAELAARTGMTAAQVIEEALRAYTPPPGPDIPHGLIDRGGLLVSPAQGRRITLAETLAAIEAGRDERGA